MTAWFWTAIKVLGPGRGSGPRSPLQPQDRPRQSATLQFLRPIRIKRRLSSQSTCRDRSGNENRNSYGNFYTREWN